MNRYFPRVISHIGSTFPADIILSIDLAPGRKHHPADSIRISDPDLATDSAMLRNLLVTAAANSGRNVVCRPLVAGIRNSIPLRASLRRTQDSVWIRIDLDGRIVADSLR